MLLADEPTGNLDSVQADKIMTLLRQLVEERRQTLLMVTHDAGHAARADRIIYLSDGRIADGERGRVSAPSIGCSRGADATPLAVRHAAECVEWSVVPPPSSFNAVSFVTPCAGDALEHAPGSEDAA